MKIIRAILLSIAALCGAAIGGNATAAVSYKFVQGTSCAASAAAIPITTTGGTVTVSVCVTTTASERVCSATYNLISTNAAANTAAVVVASRAATAPLTNITDITAFPATLSNTATLLGNSVPPSGTQTGGTGTDVKVAELSLTVPAGLAGATTFSYGLQTGTSEIANADPMTTNCNDTNFNLISVTPAAAGFDLVTPATPSTAVFTVSPATVNVTEAGATANVTVTCTGAFASNQSLPVSLAFTTTNAAGNFTTTASPLSFAACGGATQTITVTPRVEDSTVQGPVSGSIALTAPAAGVATLGSPSSVTVNVADNDTPPVFGLVKAGACAEPTTSCTFTVVRESGITNNTAVGFTISGTATRGTDYTLNDTGCGGPVIVGN